MFKILLLLVVFYLLYRMILVFFKILQHPLTQNFKRAMEAKEGKKHPWNEKDIEDADYEEVK